MTKQTIISEQEFNDIQCSDIVIIQTGTTTFVVFKESFTDEEYSDARLVSLESSHFKQDSRTEP